MLKTAKNTSRSGFRIAGNLFFTIGLLCVIYYLIIVAGHGFHIATIWIWPTAGILFIGAGWCCRMLEKNGSLVSRLYRKFCKKAHRSVGFRRNFPALITGALLVVFLLYFTAVELLVMTGIRSKGETGLDYLIVLGAGIYGTEPSAALRSRVDTAIRYLNENPDTVVIVSGGQGADEIISEAECMARLLSEAGIDASRIIKEEGSSTTVENLRYSYEIIGSLHPDLSRTDEKEIAIGVVTSNFHVFRAVTTAKAQGGYQICGIAAPFAGTLLPHYIVREFLAFTADGIRGNLFASP